MRTSALLIALCCALAGGAAGAQNDPARSRVVARLSDSTFWPEGIDADPATATLYVASVKHGTIAAIARDGTARELLPRDVPTIGSILGVRYDARRNVVWATTSALGQARTERGSPSLLEIRPKDGEILRRWTLSNPAGGRVIGDLALGPNGEVYLTDSVQPVLYVLRTEADTLEPIGSPLFKSLQGMAGTSDGRFVYIADYSSGLLRLNLATREVGRVAVASNVSTRGCDGIVLHHNAIVAVQNGATPPRIVRFALNATGDSVSDASIVDRNLPLADEPTIGTMLGDEFVYVANSQWDKHDDRGARIATHPLAAPLILGVRIP